MTRYTVTIIEVVETTYEIEIETDEGETQARLLAEDLLVNYEEAAAEVITGEKQLSQSATVTPA